MFLNKNKRQNIYSKFYDENIQKMYSYGLNLCHDHDLVKDAIHEVFVKLLHNDTIPIPQNPEAYLIKALRNKIHEELRSSRRKEFLKSRAFEYESAEVACVEELIVNLENRNSQNAQLQHALNKLSPKQREIIYLKYTLGYKYDEISKTLNIDIASVRTSIYRSLKQIKVEILELKLKSVGQSVS